MTNHLPSAVVARRLGIKTQTLAKWRVEGKGPMGWFHLSATRVVYPEDAVEVFIHEKAGTRPDFNLRPRPATAKMEGRTEAAK